MHHHHQLPRTSTGSLLLLFSLLFVQPDSLVRAGSGPATAISGGTAKPDRTEGSQLPPGSAMNIQNCCFQPRMPWSTQTPLLFSTAQITWCSVR